MNTTEVIEAFRQQERPESAAVLIDDDDLAKLIGLWPAIGATLIVPFEEAITATEAPCLSLWKWLWGAFEVDLENLAAALGVPQPVAEARLEQCIIHRLIYPDGSTNRFASGYVGARIRASLIVPGARQAASSASRKAKP